jgi:hypothetical protein
MPRLNPKADRKLNVVVVVAEQVLNRLRWEHFLRGHSIHPPLIPSNDVLLMDSQIQTQWFDASEAGGTVVLKVLEYRTGILSGARMKLPPLF